MSKRFLARLLILMLGGLLFWGATPGLAFTARDLRARNDLVVDDDAAIGGDATIAGTLVVTGTITATAGIVGSEGVGTVADGTAASPGLQWSEDGDTGFYRIGANNLGLSITGTKRWDFGAATSALSGILTVSGAATVTGALAGNGGFALDTTLFTVADTTGVLSAVPTTTTSNAWVLDFTTLTTGNGLKLIGVDATLDGGKYINIYGESNATSVWSVGEGGQTYITPIADDTPGLYVDGILTASADLITLRADDDILDGGLYIECLGGASYNTSVFSVAEGGAVAVAGTLAAAGNATIGGTLVTTGATTCTGALAINGGLTFDSTVFSITNTTGAISSVPTATTTHAWTLDCSLITSGDMINLIGVDSKLTTGGSYITCMGGTNATIVWEVGESGKTTITPSADVMGVFIDGTLLVAQDALTIKTVAATLTGGLFIECLDSTTTKFSVAEGGNVAAVGTLTITGATALNGTANVKGHLGFAIAGGTPVASAGLLGGAGSATGTVQTLGSAGGKAFEFYLGSTSTTATHELHGFYLNMNYGTAHASAAPSGDAMRGRAYLVGDAAGGTAITGGAFSVELATNTASNTGLTAGMRGNLVLPDGVMTNSGTYYGTMAEVYLGGAATDTTAYTKIAPLGIVVSGTAATAASQVANMVAIAIDIPSNMVTADGTMVSTGGTLTVAGKIKISINGTNYWLAYDSTDD